MNMLEPKRISRFGIGTWGIGGFAEKDPHNDDAKQIDALRYTLEKGINYIDTATMYGGGYSLKLIKSALHGLDRSTIFINSKITGTIEQPEDIEKQIDFYLKELGLEYLDSIMLHAPWRSNIPLEITFREMEKVVRTGKARFLSVSNCIVEQLDLFRETVKEPLFAHEGDYNFEVRVHDDIGTVKNCQEHGTRFICYCPLRRGRSAQSKNLLLGELAQKYGKTQNQVILNWLSSKKLFLPIIKSSTREHIDENFGSFDFTLDPEDFSKLEKFRVDFPLPKPDKYLTGDGLKVSGFSIYLNEKDV